MDGWMDGWTDGRSDGRMEGWMDGRSLHVLFYSVLHFKTSLSTPINGWANASKEPPGICAQFLSLREVLVNHIALPVDCNSSRLLYLLHV